tara:strand:+ start:329 stop:709 length:381 start_codon:yes stop_codon:yes gene_type:complete
MARINKALLRKAKQQIQKAAKEGSEDANNILSRRKERQVERREAARNNNISPPRETVAWNFEPGELVGFKRNRAPRYNSRSEDLYIVIGTLDGCTTRYGSDETASYLEVTGPLGIITVRSADMKKI